MKTVGKIVLAGVILMVLFIGGCFALVGGVASEMENDSGNESTTGKKSGDDAGDSDASGDPNVVGNWRIENMNQVKFTEEFGSFKSVPLKVRNESDTADSPWFEIRLTDKKGDLVAEFDCIGDEYEPGQGGTVECSTLDDFAKFADWELRNAF